MFLADVVQFVLDMGEMGIGPSEEQTLPEKQLTFDLEADLALMLHTRYSTLPSVTSSLVPA